MKKTYMKLLAMVFALILVLSMAACGSSSDEETSSQDNASKQEQENSGADSGGSENGTSDGAENGTADGAENGTSGKDVLVIYFSETGNTKAVAEKIATITDADIYQIIPAKEYTDEDLDYDNDESRATVEQNDPTARPEIGSDPVSLEGYSTIYLGYPIWWGQEPRIMDTFVESCDFSGKTVIPFCTSGSSDIGDTGKTLAENAGSGKWLDGKRFPAGATEDEIKDWIK